MTHAHPWSCFGKFWDSGQPECIGGFDLAYTSSADRSNYRKPCSAYEQCRALKEGRVTPHIIPPSNLARPPTPPAPHTTYPQQGPPRVPPVPPAPPTAYTQPVQTWQPPAWQPPALQQQQQPHYAPVPPHAAQMGPAVVPSPYQAVGAQMPGYLAIPEPMDGTPWWARLAAELVRAAFKALGHAAASFIDHNPIRMYPQPPPPQQPPAPPSN